MDRIVIFMGVLSVLGLPASAQTPAQTRAQTRAWIGATLVNPGVAPVADAVVVTEGGRIVAAGPAARTPVPPGAERIEVKGAWITPGLIDAHVHFFQSGGLYTRPDGRDLRAFRSYEREQELIRQGLPDTFARTLRCGVTGVVDMGGPNWNFEVKDQAARTEAAPRVWVAGPLLTPGPIQDQRTGGAHFLTTGPDPAVIAGTTAEAARAEVRRQKALGADLFKIWVAAGATTEAERAAYAEARKLGLRVAVHATSLAGARAAVAAGADILVHSVLREPIPDSLIAEMKRKGVILIPTLVVFRGGPMIDARLLRFDPWEFERAEPHIMGTLFDILHLPPAPTAEQAQAIQAARPWTPPAAALDNLRRLVAGGVTVAAGTDAGNPGTFHGASYLTELRLMAQAGLTPAQLLACATRDAAKVAGRTDLGEVRPGALADLLVLDADPTADILNLQRLRWVVKGGRPWRPEDLVRPSAADIVQRQVNAYNARDVQAFAETYAEGVRIHRLPGAETMLVGRKALLERYGAAFARLPDAAVRIGARMVDGDFVIDQEHLMHRWDPSQARFAATALYRVQDGLIQEVWFLDRPQPPKPR